jgi:hypothetical protein
LARRELRRRRLGYDAFGNGGVLNDARSIYFADATLANAFVARWCLGAKIEPTGGAFQVREDEPVPRVGAALHRTP